MRSFSQTTDVEEVSRNVMIHLGCPALQMIESGWNYFRCQTQIERRLSCCGNHDLEEEKSEQTVMKNETQISSIYIQAILEIPSTLPNVG